MPTEVKCLASLQAGKYPVPSTVARRDLRPDDIEIKIMYCGICHSDIHHVRNNWGSDGYGYPVVPGHEIVGKVLRVGADVSKFKVGDSVGVGCMVDSFQTCATCKYDRDQYCDSTTFTYGSRDRRVTAYSPLRRWCARPDWKVGVVSLGGIGHMSLKIATAMGADVTLFSRSHGTAEHAECLGVDHFLISSDPGQMETVAGQFNLIIDTVPYNHDVNLYVKALVPEGSLVLIEVSHESL
ncbi:chaperonin 10-like protein [Lipomyces doorenjongii]